MASIPRPLRRPLLVVAAVLLSLGLGEVAVRVIGGRPYSNATEYRDRPIIVMRDADPVLGWRNRPGEYRDPADEERRIRVLEDGSRITSEVRVGSSSRAVLIGGSFVFGHGLDDSETLAWRLQASDPERRYENHGVSGYGTYQSLLVLEALLATEPPPELVLYGLIEHHKERSIGKLGWLKHLSRSASSTDVALPYCTLDEDGRLVRHPAQLLPEWPLMRTLACVNMAQDVLFEMGDRRRMGQRHSVVEALLAEMDRACTARGARLIVMLMEPRTPDETVTTRLVERSGVEFVDLRFPHTPELRVSDADGHPNGIVTERWARTVRDAIARGAPSDDEGR